MKIAVPFDNGQVLQHFGRAAEFKMYEVLGGAVVSSEVVSTGGITHRGLADFLAAQHVDATICGGMGSAMAELLEENGIAIQAGVTGEADKAVRHFLLGILKTDPGAVHACSHGHGEGGR